METIEMPATNKRFGASGGATRPSRSVEQQHLALVRAFAIPPPAPSRFDDVTQARRDCVTSRRRLHRRCTPPFGTSYIWRFCKIAGWVAVAPPRNFAKPPPRCTQAGDSAVDN